MQAADDKIKMIKSYRTQVETELNDICNDILQVLDKHLIPCSDTGESKVFYYKMKGDYHRYLAEFATANDRKEAAENSLVAYKAASDIAMTELPTTHPIRYIILTHGYHQSGLAHRRRNKNFYHFLNIGNEY